MAASSQLAQAITLSALNGVGYNASINQTIVGGLVGAGSAVKENKMNRKNVINIVVTWFWSPILGIASAAVASLSSVGPDNPLGTPKPASGGLGRMGSLMSARRRR
ncbi:MAG: hypothetical protein ACR2KG_02090 [Nocardioidaceae bacterium]